MSVKLLVVDDHQGVRRLLEELFRREGWQVYGASDGLEALRSLPQYDPDMVIMDYRMPQMNGIDAAREMLKLRGGMPIIMMTAHGEAEIARRAEEAGVKCCVAKPFDIDHLRALAARYLPVGA